MLSIVCVHCPAFSKMLEAHFKKHDKKVMQSSMELFRCQEISLSVLVVYFLPSKYLVDLFCLLASCWVEPDKGDGQRYSEAKHEQLFGAV